MDLQETHFGDFLLNDEGVFHNNNRDETIEVCSPLLVVAVTRNLQGKDWGKLLSLLDPEGNEKQHHMKNAALISKPQSVITDLVHKGLMLSAHPRARTSLLQYLRSVSVTAKMLSSSQPGWVGNSFLLQDISIGSETVLYSGENNHQGISVSGDWKNHVGKYCAGNSRLVLSASSAFAAPLLAVLEMEGGGFHLRGSSSVGKSTALEVAASVYGSPSSYVQNWNTTHNAVESVAEAHNDCLMVLDELGQVEPEHLGETLYMLANGQGKSRMGQPKRKWKVLFLTSGEVSLADHMAQAGKETKKGQEVRLLDIAADAGMNMGLFEDLHGFTSPAEFATYLKAATRKHHGDPIQAFLSVVTASRTEIEAECRQLMSAFTKLVTPANVTGEVPRAILRFAVAAAAGELATRYNLTGWNEGEAINAAEKCFVAWMEHRRSFDPVAKAVDQVRKFIVENEDRFENEDGGVVEDKVGHKKKSAYLIPPDVFRDYVCAGTKPEEVAAGLERAGYLHTSGKNRLKKQERIDGQQVYVYSVSSAILDAAA